MRFRPEPGKIPIVLFGCGVGFVSVMVAAFVMTTDWANGPRGGSPNLLPPGLSPAGVARTVLLLPVSAGPGAAAAMDAAGRAVDVRAAFLARIAVPVGLGGLAGLPLVWHLRR